MGNKFVLDAAVDTRLCCFIQTENASSYGLLSLSSTVAPLSATICVCSFGLRLETRLAACVACSASETI